MSKLTANRNERGEIDLLTLVVGAIVLVLIYLAVFTETDVPALIATFFQGMVEVWTVAIRTVIPA